MLHIVLQALNSVVRFRQKLKLISFELYTLQTVFNFYTDLVFRR